MEMVFQQGEQMKQEPTAWLSKERDVITFDNLFPEMTPLYEKREWVKLTDEEIDGMVEVTDLSGAYYYDDLLALAKAIEAKLKELNT
jgi:hypothetical protein